MVCFPSSALLPSSSSYRFSLAAFQQSIHQTYASLMQDVPFSSSSQSRLGFAFNAMNTENHEKLYVTLHNSTFIFCLRLVSVIMLYIAIEQELCWRKFVIEAGKVDSLMHVSRQPTEFRSIVQNSIHFWKKTPSNVQNYIHSYAPIALSVAFNVLYVCILYNKALLCNM